MITVYEVIKRVLGMKPLSHADAASQERADRVFDAHESAAEEVKNKLEALDRYPDPIEELISRIRGVPVNLKKH